MPKLDSPFDKVSAARALNDPHATTDQVGGMLSYWYHKKGILKLAEEGGPGHPNKYALKAKAPASRFEDHGRAELEQKIREICKERDKHREQGRTTMEQIANDKIAKLESELEALP